MANQKRTGRAGERTTEKNPRANSSSFSGRTSVKKSAKTSVYNRYNNAADSEKTAVFYAVGQEGSEVSPVGENPQSSVKNPHSKQYTRENPQYGTKEEMSKRKKIAFGVLGGLLILIIAAGTAFAFYINDINNRLAGTKTVEEMSAIEEALAPVLSYQEPFYVLLLGTDARPGEGSEGHRSDTNICVRVDPLEGIVSMVSVPRDTMIDLKGYGRNKFNAAFAYEGVPGAIRETNTLLGVQISHFVEVDFDHFEEVVNVLGGVEVDVPERINDWQAGPDIIEAGLQTLNGEQALTFARTRQFADGDFTRTSNQRILVEAIVKKVMQTPLPDMPGVIQALANSVTTDMKIQDMVGIATQMRNLGNLTIYSAMVPSSTAMISEISYVVTDKEALKEMMKLVVTGQDHSAVVGTNFAYDGGGQSSSGGGNSYNSGGTAYVEEPEYTYTYEPPPPPDIVSPEEPPDDES